MALLKVMSRAARRALAKCLLTVLYKNLLVLDFLSNSNGVILLVGI